MSIRGSSNFSKNGALNIVWQIFFLISEASLESFDSHTRSEEVPYWKKSKVHKVIPIDAQLTRFSCFGHIHFANVTGNDHVQICFSPNFSSAFTWNRNYIRSNDDWKTPEPLCFHCRLFGSTGVKGKSRSNGWHKIVENTVWTGGKISVVFGICYNASGKRIGGMWWQICVR